MQNYWLLSRCSDKLPQKCELLVVTATQKCNVFLHIETVFYKLPLLSTNHSFFLQYGDFFLQITTFLCNIATFFYKSQLFSTFLQLFVQYWNFFLPTTAKISVIIIPSKISQSLHQLCTSENKSPQSSSFKPSEKVLQQFLNFRLYFRYFRCSYSHKKLFGLAAVPWL